MTTRNRNGTGNLSLVLVLCSHRIGWKKKAHLV